MRREAWLLRGWAWLGGRLLDDEGELGHLRERGRCVHACVCVHVSHLCKVWETPFQGLPELGSVQESRERERLGCRVWREAGGLVLEGLAGPALRTVGNVVGERGARICLSPGCLSSCCLLCMSRARGDRPSEPPPTPTQGPVLWGRGWTWGRASRGLWCL